jgi:DNA polymerase-3 subunit epsilon
VSSSLLLGGEVFTAFDVETTGLIPGVHRIVEIGAVSFRVEGVIDVFQELVDPGVPMPEDAGRVNGITDDMLQGKPDASSVLPRFLGFLGSSHPVAHNAMFDVGFLYCDAARLGLTAPDIPVLDTRLLAMKAFPGRVRYSLESLRQDHGLGSAEAHRALADAQSCRELFLLCVERLSEAGVQDLDELVRLSGGPLSFSGHAPPEVERIAELQAAIDGSRSVEISYVSGRGERTVRKITPIGFRVVGGAPAIEAYCHLREEKRTFLVASIESIASIQ